MASTIKLHRDVAGWITLNNRFSEHDKRGGKRADWKYRAGLLFQLGDFAGSKAIFGGVRITPDAGSEMPIPKDAFTWINIVSEHQPSAAPLLVGEEYYLYPNNHDPDDDDLCKARRQARAWANDPNKPDPVQGVDYTRFLRDKKIHHDLATRQIITYWYGSSGYQIAATPAVTVTLPHTSYVFTLNDKVRIEVYKDTKLVKDYENKFPAGDYAIELLSDNRGIESQSDDRGDPPWQKP